MVYRDCDVGSAKPSKDILKKFPHEMVDVANPDKVFTAADFYNLSHKGKKQCTKLQNLILLNMLNL